ncbi:hypothetical protein TZ03_01925 [Pseudomonas sp. 10-1B]|nr:hypothetical protein TZ03_01925 [Pseudomonas sp. 10-1B]
MQHLKFKVEKLDHWMVVIHVVLPIVVTVFAGEATAPSIGVTIEYAASFAVERMIKRRMAIIAMRSKKIDLWYGVSSRFNAR